MQRGGSAENQIHLNHRGADPARPWNVALYARVSKEQCRKCGRAFDNHADADHEFQGQDPEAQLQPLREMCRSRGWKIIKEYIDQGFSGAKASRPALDELMLDVERGYRYFDAVCVWKFDRFARSTTHLCRALETFQALGIAFVSLTESVDTGTSYGKLVFTVLAAVAELERSLIAERIRNGMRKAGAKKPGRKIGAAGPSKTTLWRRSKGR
jgi:DNA invertase Pin-like site-specific DNA recombinase